MPFNSIAFLIFAPVFFLVYFYLRGRPRLAWCIVASYLFYAWWDWRFVGLLILSTTTAFYSGLMIARSPARRAKKRWLWFCLVAHLGALFFFKYLNFGLQVIGALFRWMGIEFSHKVPGIVLPLGISFITFTALSYVLDVYRGRIDAPEQDLLVFGAYRCLFPQLIAGPILRAPHILPQLKTDQAFDWSRAWIGFEMIVWGYLLKLCLADNAVLFVTPRFADPELFTSFSLSLSVLAFAVQIYGDFAGYSLIAVGLARIMGFDFPMNFDRPYFSARISDFWRRWHITLGTWFRDYVFLPSSYALSRRLRRDRYFGIAAEIWIYVLPTLMTMSLIGLWHGASITFLFWGLLHGFYLSGQRVLHNPLRSLRRIVPLPRLITRSLGTLTVFGLVCLSWVFFRAKDMADAIYITKSLFSWNDTAHLSFGGMKFQLLRISLVVIIVLLVEILSGLDRVRSFYDNHICLQVSSMAVATLVILYLGNFSSNAFIYFQF